MSWGGYTQVTPKKHEEKIFITNKQNEAEEQAPFLYAADFFKDTQAEKYQSRYVGISFSKELAGQLSQASNYPSSETNSLSNTKL